MSTATILTIDNENIPILCEDDLLDLIKDKMGYEVSSTVEKILNDKNEKIEKLTEEREEAINKITDLVGKLNEADYIIIGLAKERNEAVKEQDELRKDIEGVYNILEKHF